METPIYFGVIALLYLLNALIAKRLSWLLVDWKGPLFRFKPFSCRPCLSFWLTLSGGLGLAYYLNNGYAVLLAIAVSFVNYLYIKSLTNIID